MSQRGTLLWSSALPCSCVMPVGIWGSRGAERLGGTAVASTREARKEDGLMGRVGEEEVLGWGYPHDLVSSISPSSVIQKWGGRE